VTAAVTGATGMVGRFIVDRLVEEGVSVRAWRRPTSDVRGLPSAVEWIEGDLSSSDAAAALVEGADMLVHSALEHVPGRYRRGEGEDVARYLETNVGCGLSLLATARQAGVRRCVVLSSRAVFGATPVEGRISDDDPVRPDTNYGAAKAALEMFVRSWGASEGWPIAALRPTGVYGVVTPIERSKWFDLVGAALKREPVEPRAGSEVHGRDVAEAVWLLLTAPPDRIAGRMFNCSDIVVSTRDLVRLVHHVAHMTGPVPDESPPPHNLMDCSGLKSLGTEFGGWPLLEETIAELIAARS
jgi:UDP-glucose 4-epimerase